MVILIRLEAVAGPDEISSIASAVEVARVRLEDGWLLLLSSLTVCPGCLAIVEPTESRSLSMGMKMCVFA
jgi:hypothetical protein